MLISPRDKTSLRTLITRSMDSLPPSTRTTTAWPSLFQRIRRRSSRRRSRLLRRNWKSLADSSPLSRSLLTLSTTSLPLITPSRLLIPGRMLLLLNLRISMSLPEECFLRTELPEPWTSRRTLLPSLRSSRPTLRLSSTSFPKETRFPLMPRSSRMNSPESPYVQDLQAKTKVECDKYSNDVKYWAEYRTGIKEFAPWLASAEKSAAEGLSKPSDLNEVKALNDKVNNFDKTCLNYLKVLDAANAAAQKMTTHKEADDEVAGLRERYSKVKSVSDVWVKKCEVLVKEWVLLDNTVTELNSWVAKDKSAEGENQFSLEKMESTLGELKNIFKQKEKLVANL